MPILPAPSSHSKVHLPASLPFLSRVTSACPEHASEQEHWHISQTGEKPNKQLAGEEPFFFKLEMNLDKFAKMIIFKR
jgi:hypothetical protein